MKQMWRSMVLFMMLLGVLATAAWGSQPSTQWAASAGYPGTPYKVVTDAQRNVYVTGTTYSADTNTSTSTADMLTAKYDVNGSKLWEIRYNGPYNGFDAGYTIAVDEGGNVFVAGASSNGSSTNAIFAKYNPDGQELWFRRYTENQNFPSSCGTLSLDDAGNVYLALVSAYDNPAYVWVSGFDIVVLKYDTNGNRIWKQWLDSPTQGDDGPAKIIATNNFVYVAGSFDGDDHGYGNNLRNYALFKFTLDGQFVRTVRYDGGNQDNPSDFQVDDNDNVYITGSSDRLHTGTTQWDQYLYDYATVKFDTNGVRQWVARYSGTADGQNFPSSLELDASGDVYVTGASAGAGTGLDITTIKYSGASGAQLWVDRYNGTANSDESGGKLLVDANGDVNVSGTSVNAGKGQDYTVIKYSPDGTRQWVELYNGAANGSDTLSSMAHDALGNIYVTGASTDAGGIPQFLTVKYLVDSTPPVTTVAPSGDVNGSGVYTSNALLQFTGTDSNSGVQQTVVSIDGGAFTPLPANSQVVIADNGTHTVSYYSVDASGNQETVKTLTVTVQRTLYVRTDGADLNSGFGNNAAGAFRTINFAVNQARPGDVIEVQAGTYNETVYPAVGGTADKHILVRGDGRVVLDGQNAIGTAIAPSAGARFVDFANLEIMNYTGCATYFHSFDNTFTNCVFHNNARIAEGVADYASTTGGYGRQRFVDCTFYNNGSTGAPMIRAYWAHGFTFENCDFYSNTGDFVIWFAHSQNANKVDRCRFYNNTAANVISSGDLQGSLSVTNSVFYNNATAMTFWGDNGYASTNVYNNIVVSNTLGLAGPGGSAFTADYNLIWNNITNYAGVAAGAHDLSTAPLFTNAASGDFHLSPSSPAVDRGIDLGQPFNNAAPDLGAYETRFLYVRPDGLDQNSGQINSAAGAFRTIQHAVDVAQPGDVVAVQEGIYNEQVSVSSGGTADKHITVLGVGKVVLDGQQQLGYAIGTGTNAQYVDFENLEIRNYTVMATYFHSYDNRFTNCDFNNNVAVYEGYADYAGYGRQSFVNCKFHDNIGPDYLIRAYFAQGVTFDGCDFYNNNNSIVVWWAHSQDVNTIVRSRFYNNRGAATGTGDLIGTVNVFNSVFYNNASALSTWDDRWGSTKVWKNNIIVNNGFGMGKSYADGGTVINDHNLVWNNTTNYDTTYLSVGVNDITADPLFTNAAAGDLTLLPFSPAIDRGTALGYAFYGAAPDLGAFEKMSPSTRSSLNGTLGQNGWHTTDVTASITSDIPVAVAEIRSSLNGATETATPGNTAAIPLTQEGVSALTFYAVDVTGKREATDNAVNVKIDKTAPVTTALLTGTLGDNGYYVSAVQATLTATDSVSGVAKTEYSVDGTTWITYTAPLNITAERNTTLDFRSVDAAGNIESATSVTVKIDRTAPTVSSTSPANQAVNVATNASITVNFGENINQGSTFAGITLTQAGTPVATTNNISGSKVTLKPSAQLSRSTVYTVTVPAGAVKDAAGHVNAAYTFSFTTAN